MQAHAAAQLLHEHGHALGGAQHQHQVHGRYVDALIEEVDGEQALHVAFPQALDGIAPVHAVRPGVDRQRRDAPCDELRSHVARVFYRHAEPQRSRLRGRVLLPLLDNQLHAVFAADRGRQLFFVEPGAASVQQGRGILHRVRHAVVVEGRQPAVGHGLEQPYLVGHVAAHQREEVAAVAAEGRGR